MKLMDFKTRAYLTLTKQSGGLLGAEMYVDSLDAFSAVVKDPSYYVADADSENWAACAQDIADLIPEGTPAVEYGPGGTNMYKKTLNVVEALRSKKYTGIDVNKTSLDQALQAILHLKRDIEGVGINRNFWEDDFPIADKASLAMIAGCSIENLEAPLINFPPRKELVQVLKALGRRTNGGWLLISADALDVGHSLEEYLHAYRGTAHSAFNLGVFDRIKRAFARDLDVAGFSYRAEFHEPSGAILHMAYATKDQIITFCGERLPIFEGDAFHLQNSFRFTEKFFMDCVEESRMKTLKIWRHPKTSMQLYLLRADVEASSSTDLDRNVLPNASLSSCLA